MKQDIILIGGGGHCKACIDVIEQEGKFNILGILDTPRLVGKKILGYDIMGTDDDFINISKSVRNYFITVGQIKLSAKRIALWKMVKQSNCRLPVIISSHAYVAKSAIIQEGTIVMHNAIINAEARIGRNCIINTNALIEHEAHIGGFCHISTGAIINGQSVVGDRCFIGSNTVVVNNICIASDTVIGAGSQVIKNIDVSGTYLGHPLQKSL